VILDDDGTVIAVVQRTNNVDEHFFGNEKQQLRRRVGRAHLGRDLEDQPAQAESILQPAAKSESRQETTAGEEERVHANQPPSAESANDPLAQTEKRDYYE